jgi:CBS domain-containing protein
MDLQNASVSYPPPSGIVPSISVKELLDAKGRQVWSVDPDSHVVDAIRIMTKRRVGAVPVMRSGKLEGILSERDCLRRVIVPDLSPKATAVREVMTSVVITVGSRRSLQDCMRIMTDRGIRHLPVVERERVVGLVSIGDVVKASLSYQQYLLDEVERYVQGAPTAASATVDSATTA